MERGTQHMNERDGGLAKHNVKCAAGINWEDAKVIEREEGRMQQKMLDGVEIIKRKRFHCLVIFMCLLNANTCISFSR